MTKIIDLKTEQIIIEDFLNEKIQLDDQILYRHDKTPKKALVYLANQCRTYGNTPEEIKAILALFKEKIPKLYQENKVTDDDLMFMAFRNYDIAKVLIEQKLISPNIIANENIIKYDSFLSDCIGVPLIHRFNSHKILRELIAFGADIHIKSQNKGWYDAIDKDGKKQRWQITKNGESEVGLTLYELAVKNKQKGLIKALLQILPKDNLDTLNQVKLNELLAEKNYKKQYKILVKSAREGNKLVLDEIIKNLDLYKEALLFDGTKKINKDLLHYSLEFGQREYVKQLIEFNIFPKNNEHCYTTFALEKKQSEVALLAFDEGYYHQENLIISMLAWHAENSRAYNYIANEFNSIGIKIPLDVLFYRGIHSYLESSISEYKNDIEPLIKKKSYIFDIGFIKAYNNNTLMQHEIDKKHFKSTDLYHEQYVNVSQNKIKFVFKLLKCMFEQNMENTENYLDNFIASINKSPIKQMMIYLKIGIDVFPEKQRQFIEKITNDTVRANFEKKLFEQSIVIEEDEVYQPKRKFKI